MKSAGGRASTVALAAALICLVIAIGAGLQGQLSFGGPLWTPVIGKPPPIVQPTTTTPPQPTTTANPITHNHPVVISWIPIIIVLSLLVIALIVLLVRLWLRTHPRRVKTQTFTAIEGVLDDMELTEDAGPDLPTLQRGLALATVALDTEREPRDAIVRAWIGLQEAAEDSGMRRRASETPTEFTARVFATVHADRAAADTLLAIYLRVRFGSTPATASDVKLAQESIATLTATWESV